MTGPTQGQGDETPQPWGGKPDESRYGTPWDERPANPYFADPDEDLPPVGMPPRGPNRKVLAGIAGAVVIIVGAGVALWWFAVGPGRDAQPSAAASGQHPAPQAPVRPVPSTSPAQAAPSGTGSPSTAPPPPHPPAAYDVGMCFDEVAGTSPGTVELNPVACAGSRAVFVINDVVASAPDCDTGQGAADYHNHGYEVPDETANVAYCASLVVPADTCFVLGASAPIARAACGSGPNVVQVTAIEPAANAAGACADKSNPDVWFYQAPTSGRFACVTRPVTVPTTARH